MAATLSDYPRPAVLPGSLERAKPDWVAGPIALCKRSTGTEVAAFDALSKHLWELDPEMQDHEAILFEHWHAGWVIELFSRPGSACADYVTQTTTKEQGK